MVELLAKRVKPHRRYVRSQQGSSEPCDTSVASHSGGWRPWLRFLLHLGEMVVAMYAGMYLLGMPSGAILSAIGISDSDPVTSALVMTFNMTVPMVLWMRIRGHTWERAGEMGAAMVLPSVVIVALAIAGAIPRAGLSGTVMYPMIPAMLVAMLYRRSEYAHCGTHRSEPALDTELELAG